MEKSNDPRRNLPAEEGRNNDPNVRDDSAIKPGINTVSDSSSDEDDEQLTETAADNFREDKKDKNAQTRFDEIDKD